MVVKMGRVDQILNFCSLVLGCHRNSRLEHLGEDIEYRAGSVLFVQEKLKLLLVILEAANQVQLLGLVVLLQLHVQLGVVVARGEICIQLDCLDHKLLAQRSDIVSDPVG